MEKIYTCKNFSQGPKMQYSANLRKSGRPELCKDREGGECMKTTWHPDYIAPQS